jgi:hypothetical protein
MNHDPTPPLDEFIVAYENEANLWWRTDCGHHMNLFEAAVARMEKAEAELLAEGEWSPLQGVTIEKVLAKVIDDEIARLKKLEKEVERYADNEFQCMNYNEGLGEGIDALEKLKGLLA